MARPFLYDAETTFRPTREQTLRAKENLQDFLNHVPKKLTTTVFEIKRKSQPSSRGA